MKKSELRQIIKEEISKLVSTNEMTSNTSKLFNVWWGSDESAKELNRKIRKMDDKGLLRSLWKSSMDGGEYRPMPSKLNTPVNIKIALIYKEMERRGLKLPSDGRLV